MKGEAAQFRFQDQAEAGRQAGEWIEECAIERGMLGNPAAEIRIENLQGEGGCVYTLWIRNRVVAHAVIVRDEWNYSVLTCVAIEETERRAAAPSEGRCAP